LVMEVARRGPIVAIQGTPPDLETLRDDGAEIVRLAAAILQYIGKLSELEHTAEDSAESIKLIETVNDLEGISDIVATNLLATGQQRLVERVDLASLRDESTSRFAAFIIEKLAATVATLGEATPDPSEPLAQVKAEMETLMLAARTSVLDRIK